MPSRCVTLLVMPDANGANVAIVSIDSVCVFAMEYMKRYAKRQMKIF